MRNNLGSSLINSWVNKISERKIYEFDSFRLDAGHRILSRNGRDIDLAPKAVETLVALVEHRGDVISKDELLDTVWPDTIVDESNLFSYLSHLRKALGNRKDGKPYVETLRRRGYRFTGDVKVIADTLSEFPVETVHVPANLEPTKVEPVRPSTNGERVVALPQRPRVASDGQPSAIEKDVSGNTGPSVVPVRNTKRGLVAATALSILMLGSFGLYRWRENSPSADAPVKTIVVLPFKPLVAGNRDEALETGIAEDLITRLSTGEHLKVRPLAAVRRFGSLDQDPLAAGRELDVDFVLETYVQIADKRILISPKLLRVSDGTQIWAYRFERPLADIFDVQTSISGAIATALQVPLGARIIRDYTDDVEAYGLYKTGELYKSRLGREAAKTSISYYEEAIKLDPDYTLAYVGLAQAYRSLILSGDQDPLANIPKAKAAASRAVELDPNLSDAHIVLGNTYFWYERDWPSAELEYRKAIDLDSRNALAHLSYAHLLSNLGKHEQAIDEIQKSLNLDPTNLLSMIIQGQILTFAERYNEALQAFDAAIAIKPDVWATHLFRCRLHAQMGMHDDAIKEGELAEKLNDGYAEATSMIAYSMARSGNRDGATRLLSKLEDRARTQYVPAYTMAIIYNALGDKERALTMLEESFDRKDPLMVFLKIEPKWDNLRSEPRFVELMRKMRFE